MSPEYKDVSDETMQALRDYLKVQYLKDPDSVTIQRRFEKWYGFGPAIDLITLDGEPIVSRMRPKLIGNKNDIIISSIADKKLKEAGIDLSI